MQYTGRKENNSSLFPLAIFSPTIYPPDFFFFILKVVIMTGVQTAVEFKIKLLLEIGNSQRVFFK